MSSYSIAVLLPLFRLLTPASPDRHIGPRIPPFRANFRPICSPGLPHLVQLSRNFGARALRIRPGTRDGAVTTAVEHTIAREEADRRLVFLSDLHLATDEGKRDFFAQDEFAALLDALIAAAGPIDLIIAG